MVNWRVNSYKNFKCTPHNKFFEMNLYQKDPVNDHHWRANIARPAGDIDLWCGCWRRGVRRLSVWVVYGLELFDSYFDTMLAIWKDTVLYCLLWDSIGLWSLSLSSWDQTPYLGLHGCGFVDWSVDLGISLHYHYQKRSSSQYKYQTHFDLLVVRTLQSHPADP